jgi:hypothetical protein
MGCLSQYFEGCSAGAKSAREKGKGRFMTERERERWAAFPLEQLFDSLKLGPDVGAIQYYKALAELECRKFEGQEKVNAAQIEAAKAATEAAEAAKKTAEYTRQNAVYMLLSVIAILLTSGASVVFQFLTWAQIRPS